MQGELEPEKPTTYRPPPEKRWVPPPPEDLHLLLPVHFLNSALCPKLCLYSGRTEGVSRIRHLLYVPSADGRLRLPVLIPVAHGERLYYRLRVYFAPVFWLLGAWVVVPSLIWLLLQLFRAIGVYAGAHPPQAVSGLVAVLVLGAYMSGFLVDRWWVKRGVITWRLRAALRAVDVTFPERQRATCEAWRAALSAWEAAGQPTGDPLAEEENWSHGVDSGWDQPRT